MGNMSSWRCIYINSTSGVNIITIRTCNRIPRNIHICSVMRDNDIFGSCQSGICGICLSRSSFDRWCLISKIPIRIVRTVSRRRCFFVNITVPGNSWTCYVNCISRSGNDSKVIRIFDINSGSGSWSGFRNYGSIYISTVVIKKIRSVSCDDKISACSNFCFRRNFKWRI